VTMRQSAVETCDIASPGRGPAVPRMVLRSCSGRCLPRRFVAMRTLPKKWCTGLSNRTKRTMVAIADGGIPTALKDGDGGLDARILEPGFVQTPP